MRERGLRPIFRRRLRSFVTLRSFGVEFVRQRTVLLELDSGLLGHFDLVRGSLHALAVYGNVSVDDELSSLIRRVAQTFAVGNRLQAALQHVGHVQQQDVVQFVAVVKDADSLERSDELLALDHLGVTLRSLREDVPSFAAVATKLRLGAPEFLLVLQAVAVEETALLGDTLALIGMVRRLVELGVLSERHYSSPPSSAASSAACSSLISSTLTPMVPSVRPVERVRCPRTFWPRLWRTPLYESIIFIRLMSCRRVMFRSLPVWWVVSPEKYSLRWFASHSGTSLAKFSTASTTELISSSSRRPNVAVRSTPDLSAMIRAARRPIPFSSLKDRSTDFVPSRSVCPMRTK